MRCKECEQLALAAIMDELTEQDAVEYLQHLSVCESCQSMYESYKQIAHTIRDPEFMQPTSQESAVLNKALQEVIPVRHSEAVSALPQGMPALVFGSIAVFIVVATILALQVLGHINILNGLQQIGAVPLAVIMVITILVSSYLPIAITAQRRPLNGMTFRR